MLCVITGVAGFIGSHLAEGLLRAGHDVIGIDCFTDYYSKERKTANLASISQSERFRFVELDLAYSDVRPALEGVDFVFHLAAQPGVRASWGDSFDKYVRNNILATQRLLDAVKGIAIRKFIYASSSSIYGDAESFPTSEYCTPRPNSPYGLTKLSAEQLCCVYNRSYGVPSVILRYFTVYGPRQRPDISIYRFIDSIYRSAPIEIYGNGNQSRDFTYVEDIVSGTILAMDAQPCSIFNIGSGRTVSLAEILDALSKIMKKQATIIHMPAAVGDVKMTCADISRAQREIGYRPKMALVEGLRKQVEWQIEHCRE